MLPHVSHHVYLCFNDNVLGVKSAKGQLHKITFMPIEDTITNNVWRAFTVGECVTMTSCRLC